MADAAIECDLTYPGLEDWQGVNIMRSLGVVPDVIRVRYTPGIRPPASFGPLLFRYFGPGIGERRLLLADCQLDRVTCIATEGGFIYEATLLDARWRWAYGTISGEYNVPDPKGDILKGTERSPQELAKLLLRAMFNMPEEQDTARKGRRNSRRLTKSAPLPFDVSKLPNDTRPRTEWDDDNPARALDRLCDSLGCVVCYKWNGTVTLEPAGQGNLLRDDDDVTELNMTLDPQEVPDTVMIVGPEKRFEVILPLLPRALDTDGSYKNPYKVSYVPKALHPFATNIKQGWVDGYDPLDDPVQLGLAKESVFRCFQFGVNPGVNANYTGANGRTPVNLLEGEDLIGGFLKRSQEPYISNLADYRLNLPGFGQLDALWQILPVENSLVSFGFDLLRNDYVNKPAKIFGLFQAFDGVGMPSEDSNNFDPTTTALDEELHALPKDISWSIDPDLGIVKLEAPLIRYGTTKTGANGVEFTPKLFPILWMRITVSVRDKKTRAWEKYRRERKIGNRGTGPRIVRRPDLQHNTILSFEFNRSFQPRLKQKGGKIGDPDADLVVGIATNEARLDTVADKQIDSVVRMYQTQIPHVVSYRGLKFIEPDGAIRQVMVNAGDDGFCETMASRNDEALGTDMRLSEKQQRGFLLDQFNRGIDTKWAQERFDRKARKGQQ